jgi:hypothetical protein
MVSLWNNIQELSGKNIQGLQANLTPSTTDFNRQVGDRNPFVGQAKLFVV